MNTGELLDELRENILHDRSDRTAGTPDYLWTDAALVRYIDQAQRRFARRALCLRDATTAEVTQVTLVEGQSEYALHASVLAVISAKLTGDQGDLKRAGHSAFDAYRPTEVPWFDPAYLDQLQPGKPLAFSTDEYISANEDNGAVERVTLRVYPEPSADYDGEIINLRVARLPIERLDHRALLMYPEIPEDYHLDMLDWAAYLALRIVDRDAGDIGRAKDFAASFEQHVQSARRETMRKLFAPTPWGFGNYGWAWER